MKYDAVGELEGLLGTTKPKTDWANVLANIVIKVVFLCGLWWFIYDALPEPLKRFTLPQVIAAWMFYRIAK